MRKRSGAGNGGDISIEADQVTVQNGSLIESATSDLLESSTSENGNGGTISIKADILTISGQTGGTTAITTMSSKNGDAGNIDIDVTSTLNIQNGGDIFANAYGAGNAGNIDISASSIIMSGDDPSNPSSISALLGTGASGEGGQITIHTDVLNLEGEAQISAETLAGYTVGDIGLLALDAEASDAGSIEIFAADIALNGGIIKASTAADGNGGTILINTDSLTVQGGRGITCETQGTGNGGDLIITGDSLLIDGEDADVTGIFADSTIDGDAGSISLDFKTIKLKNNGQISVETVDGEGGDIDITAGDLELLDGGNIMAKSTGAGNAGELNINISSSLFVNNSQISTEAGLSDGGNIFINTGTMARFIDSSVTASVGGGQETVGGNINLQSTYVILKNSLLTANAFEGRGGQIDISSKVYLADASSIVDASSELGIDGSVDINAPFSNLSGSLKPLPAAFLNAANLLKEPCEARVRQGDYGSFTIKGRDALPIEPGSYQISPPPMF